LLENIPRVLPENVNAVIDAKSWQRPAIFEWLQQHGNVIPSEMYRTFNNGIGMVVCVAAEDAEQTLSLLNELGETAYQIGQIEASENAAPSVIING
jgi:phosphoribosylformylglycinamidine cyclo-ligase